MESIQSKSVLFPPVFNRKKPTQDLAGVPPTPGSSPRAPATARTGVKRGQRMPVPLPQSLTAASGGDEDPSSPAGTTSQELVVPRALSLTARLFTPSAASATVSDHQRLGSSISERSSKVEVNATPLLSCWPSTLGGGHTTSTKSMLAMELEKVLQRECAPSLGWSKRGDCLVRIFRELRNAFPSFASVFTMIEAAVAEMAHTVVETTELADARCDAVVRNAMEKQEKFYKSAMIDLLKAKRAAEAQAAEANEKAETLRKERDEELNGVKNELVETMRGASVDDHEVSHLRQLLSSVYRVNSELRQYIEELEQKVKKVDAPPDEPYVPPRFLRDQVTTDFIEASEIEMAKCRLSTQRALIDSAVTARSALRAKADAAQAENVELKERLSELEQATMQLRRQLHNERYGANVLPQSVFSALNQDRLRAVDPAALRPRMLVPEALAEPGVPDAVVTEDSPTVPSDEHVPDLLRPECYTPRGHVPFEVQSVLGIDVSARTRVVLEAVCELALRQQRAATDVNINLRRLQIASSWMEPSLVEQCVVEAAKHSDLDANPFLPTYPESEWSILPHFLRTVITPHVANLGWPLKDTCRMVREFFVDYDTHCTAARSITHRLVAPKHVPLWERRKANLYAVLDVQRADLANPNTPVPRGYALSAFVRAVTVRQSQGRVPTELEVATMAYNLWHSAKRYRFSQPICALLVQFIDGQVPLEAFNRGERLLNELYEALTAVDTTHSGAVPVKAVANALLNVYQKDAGEVWREALHAIAKTSRTHRLPMSDKLPIAGITAAENGPSGATELAQFIRLDTLRRLETFYNAIESSCAGHVKESHAMTSLCVIAVATIVEQATALDTAAKAPNAPPPVMAKVSYRTTVVAVISKLQRLNASAHLPRVEATEDAAVTDEAASATSSPRGVGKKKKVTGKAAAAMQIAALIGDQNTNDQSLVEWYAFCAALRAAPPEAESSMLTLLSQSIAAQSMSSDVLNATVTTAATAIALVPVTSNRASEPAAPVPPSTLPSSVAVTSVIPSVE